MQSRKHGLRKTNPYTEDLGFDEGEEKKEDDKDEEENG